MTLQLFILHYQLSIILPTHIHIFRNTQYPNIIDIEMENIDLLRKYDAIECHIVAYPYHREVSADDIEIHPFEEYVEDILVNHKSAYEAITQGGAKRFGFLLGMITTLVAFLFRKEGFLSAEVIASIIGAYIAGKELWADVESYLIRFSKDRKLRYFEGYYTYTLEKNTTLTQYSAFAKQQRYKKDNLLASQMDFIEQSNSKTVRLYYEKESLAKTQASAHITSIHLNPDIIEKWESGGYLIGVKLSLNQKKWGIWYNHELFQSLTINGIGCLDTQSKWHENAISFRKVSIWGKWKYFKQSGVRPNQQLISYSELHSE